MHKTHSKFNLTISGCIPDAHAHIKYFDNQQSTNIDLEDRDFGYRFKVVVVKLLHQQHHFSVHNLIGCMYI